MKEEIALGAKDYLTMFLAGLGISVAPHEFLGGMLMALAAAAYARRVMPEQDDREFWLVMLGAFLAAVLAAELTPIYAPNIPVQVAMAASGFFSRFIARFALRVAGLIEGKADTITERALDRVLPESRDVKDHDKIPK